LYCVGTVALESPSDCKSPVERLCRFDSYSAHLLNFNQLENIMPHTRSWLTPPPKPKRCKTCRFFKNDDAWEDCSCPKMIPGYTSKGADDDGVSFGGGSPLETGLNPGPNFGCIHHAE